MSEAESLSEFEAKRLDRLEAVIGGGIARVIDSMLSEEEEARLADLEGRIASAGARIYEDLRTIRDERLYRAEHETFEGYCRDRWDMSPQHANRQIAFGEVRRTLEPIGSTPANEAQARPLAPLRDEPEKMAEAWQEANAAAEAKGKPVTAADVDAAVKARLTPAPAPEPEVSAIADPEPEPAGWLEGAPEPNHDDVDEAVRQAEAERPPAVSPHLDTSPTPGPVDVTDLVPPMLLLRLEASKALTERRRLWKLDPKAVAVACEDDEISSYRHAAQEMAAWADDMLAALHERTNPNLRSVK